MNTQHPLYANQGASRTFASGVERLDHRAQFRSRNDALHLSGKALAARALALLLETVLGETLLTPRGSLRAA